MKKTTEALMQEAYEQIQHDRALMRECYDKFSDQVNNIADYAVAGQNLNKCLELLGKQSAALLEVAKLAANVREKCEETTLSAEENDEIYEKIN